MKEKNFKYAVRRGGKNFGVKNLEQLKSLAVQRMIFPHDYIFCYDFDKWVKAGQVNTLFDVFNRLSRGCNPEKPSCVSANDTSVKNDVQTSLSSSATLPIQTGGSARTMAPLALDVNSLFDGLLPDSEETLPKTESTLSNVEKSDQVYRALSSNFAYKSADSEKSADKVADSEGPLFFSGRKLWVLFSMVLVMIAMVGLGSFLLGKHLSGNDETLMMTRLNENESGFTIREIHP